MEECPRQTDETNGADTTEAFDASDYYGTPLVDESQILSPGTKGRVFNPIVVAEFRRWRARPFTYLGMVLITLAGLSLMYHARSAGAGSIFFSISSAGWFGNLMELMKLRGVAAPGAGTGGKIAQFAGYLLLLILRPSTLLPLMMVWRALVSFRDAGLYKPFRTTFLRPDEFLWGMIAVPFCVSALILIFYTGAILSPGLVRAYHMYPPTMSSPHPYFQIIGILFEGSLNGALICFIALYFGVRSHVHLSALFPILLAVLLIQSAHACAYQFGVMQIIMDKWIEVPQQEWTPAFKTLYRNALYLITGTPKLILCVIFWWLTTRLLITRDEV